jgi:hypothetical protein
MVAIPTLFLLFLFHLTGPLFSNHFPTLRERIVFLEAGPYVKSFQTISDSYGSFTATFTNDDRFGGAISGNLDINMDGVQDLVIGASRDDDGGDNRLQIVHAC